MPSIISAAGTSCAITIRAQKPRKAHTRMPLWSVRPAVEAATAGMVALKVIRVASTVLVSAFMAFSLRLWLLACLADILGLLVSKACVALLLICYCYLHAKSKKQLRVKLYSWQYVDIKGFFFFTSFLNIVPVRQKGETPLQAHENVYKNYTLRQSSKRCKHKYVTV